MDFQEDYSTVMGFQQSTVESRGFRKAQGRHGVSGKHSGVTEFQENYSGIMGFHESTVESRI
jgi:hypothetical protein